MDVPMDAPMKRLELTFQGLDGSAREALIECYDAGVVDGFFTFVTKEGDVILMLPVHRVLEVASPDLAAKHMEVQVEQVHRMGSSDGGKFA